MRNILLLTMVVSIFILSCSNDDKIDGPPSGLIGRWNVDRVFEFGSDGNLVNHTTFIDGQYVIEFSQDSIYSQLNDTNGEIDVTAGFLYNYSSGVIEFDEKKYLMDIYKEDELMLRKISETGEVIDIEIFTTRIEE